jgi:membrane protein
MPPPAPAEQTARMAGRFVSSSAWLRAFTRPVTPFLRAGALWSEVEGGRMSAAISFYGMLSLAPLLLLLVGVLGWWVDRAIVEKGLVTQLGALVGPQGSALIRHALDSAKAPAQGLIASVAGFVVLVSGATGVFTELQSAFERLWLAGSGVPAKQQWWHGVSLRLRGIAYVLAFGFLLLVSLLLSTFLNVASGWAGHWFALEQVVRVLSELIAFGICAALFYGLMRMSTGPKPGSRSLWFGSVVGATLFTAGRQVLAAYLAHAAVVSAYGAAGSLVVLLMWIYFSAAVLLFGAGCAKAVQEERVAHEQARQRAANAPPRAGVFESLRGRLAGWRQRHQ